MKPLYLIVHPELITKLTKLARPEKNAELERILKEEDYIILEAPWSQIPSDIPKDRLIRVCGIYLESCVQQAYDDLAYDGYEVQIYKPATFGEPQ